MLESDSGGSNFTQHHSPLRISITQPIYQSVTAVADEMELHFTRGNVPATVMGCMHDADLAELPPPSIF